MHLKSPLCKPPRYEQASDVMMRLGECVITYNDGKGIKVLYVTSIYDDDKILVKDILTGEEHTCNPNAEYLNVNHSRLGFINLPDGAYYAVRTPSRSQRSGIVPQRLVLYGRHDRTRIEGWQNYVHLAKCILNDYPTIQQASATGDCAFHRHFAFGPSKKKHSYLTLRYKTADIGLYDLTNKVFYIPDSRLDKSREFELSEVINTGVNQYEHYAIHRVMD